MKKTAKITKLEGTQHEETGAFAAGNQLWKLRSRHGRPSKLKGFLGAFKSVLEHDHPVGRAIIFTDEKLIEMANRELDESDRISITTWRRYKAGGDDCPADPEGILDQIRELYVEALELQAENLFERLTDPDEKRSWQRYAWIIERKFDEWNLRQKTVDETEGPRQLVFRVVPDGGSAPALGDGG